MVKKKKRSAASRPNFEWKNKSNNESINIGKLISAPFITLPHQGWNSVLIAVNIQQPIWELYFGELLSIVHFDFPHPK